ncbi:HTH-type transcriptional regulator CymR [subsurface metagenome]
MRLSTKGRYGVRAMVALALHYGEGPVSVNSISKEEGISPDYIEQLFIKLRRKGLIKSRRGPEGGFLLARPPSQIRVGDIIRGIEEPITLAPCVEENCSHLKGCTTHLLWKKIANRIAEILDSTTLDDFREERRGDEKKKIRLHRS